MLQAHPSAQGWSPDDDDVHPVEARPDMDGSAELDEEEGEDPLMIRRRRRPDPTEEALASLGKLMKGAGRSIWRRVSSKEPKRKDKAQSAISEQDDPANEGEKENIALTEKGQGELVGHAQDAPDCVEVAVNVAEVSGEQSGEEEEGAPGPERPRSDAGTTTKDNAHPCKGEAATLQTRAPAAAIQAQ